MGNSVRLAKLQANPVVMASLGAVFMVFVWSGWIILSRAGVQSSLTPADLTMIRFGTAAVFALPFALRYDWAKVTLWKAVIVSLGCGFPYTMFSFYGLLSIKAANAGVIVNGLLPVFGVILAFLVLGERTTIRRLFAIGLILLANLIMMGQPQAIQDNWFGWLMLIGASLVFSIYMFLAKRYGFTSRDALAFLPLINAVLFLPIWWMSDSGIPETPVSTILLQASYQGILVSIVTLLITFYAIKHIGAMTLSIYFSFVPFVTALLAWPILHESLSITEILGIILCSVGLLFYARKG
ncbi:DMT family transporter [Reichenbachiella agarivorans]|uniref:DMT family transporter n=1 Tax=Reichenbachiella agarivorans TaxID=2979464 RepID=A0ABY6CS37_9BACT|nr:DMT family transporter [Reichenbachiella agarivorans]UXP32258.1 DMT family transporter [Reichenbachiella agarivorans]